MITLKEQIQQRVSEVYGEKFEVISITSSGVDPTFTTHTYVARDREDPEFVVINKFVTFTKVDEYE